MSLNGDGLLEPEEYGIERMPKHVAMIMDGNGRWAQERGMIRLMGHREGARTVRRVVRLSYRLGVKHLTLFAFSAQNWSRPPAEVEGLMHLLLDYITGERKELMARGIRFRALGDLSMLPAKVKAEVLELQEASKENTEMGLNIALSYGSREEIVQASRHLAQQVKAGKIQPEDIDTDLFGQQLYTGDIPDPDLLIRTSGELRISNFMLWQIAYAELHFAPVFWPDFTDEDYLRALQEFGGRERRFGLTGKQVSRGA